MIFSKSYCPHCKAAKELLRQKNVTFEVIELDLEQKGAEMQNILEKISGQRTVPNIYINDQHIGGNSDLQAANKNGSLDAKLAMTSESMIQ